MSELKPFCNSCGICCKVVGIAVDLAKSNPSKDPLTLEASRFPHAYDETGRCEKLGPDNKCTIYDTRPDICNIARIYEKHYRKLISRKDFYDQNEIACIKFGAMNT